MDYARQLQSAAHALPAESANVNRFALGTIAGNSNAGQTMNVLATHA